MYTDGNFPASLQVLAFLGSAMFTGVLALLTAYGFAKKKPWAGKTLLVLLAGVTVYVVLLSGFSIFSYERTLARGQEKYFCEIDCHLGYSIADVQWRGVGPSAAIAVTVRTRFNEETISTHRPKNAPLMPNPRKVVLLDSAGHAYMPSSIEGTPPQSELIPGQSYTTTFVFPLADSGSSLRLLITSTDGPMVLLIGNEMSLGHRKTYLAL